MKTSIVILNYNTLSLLKNCIESINKFTKDYELIIIDNGSNDKFTDKFIKENADQYILNNFNYGFAKGNNQGARMAQGKYICFLNSDTIVTKGWLDKMIKTMEKNENCAVVGPLGNTRFRNFNNKVIEYQQYERQYKKDTQVRFLSGYCMLINAELFRTIWFDEDFETGLFEDNLLCEKVKKLGYSLFISAKSLVIHIGSCAFNNNFIDYLSLYNKNKQLFERKLMYLNGN